MLRYILTHILDDYLFNPVQEYISLVSEACYYTISVQWAHAFVLLCMHKHQCNYQTSGFVILATVQTGRHTDDSSSLIVITVKTKEAKRPQDTGFQPGLRRTNFSSDHKKPIPLNTIKTGWIMDNPSSDIYNFIITACYLLYVLLSILLSRSC